MRRTVFGAIAACLLLTSTATVGQELLAFAFPGPLDTLDGENNITGTMSGLTLRLNRMFTVGGSAITRFDLAYDYYNGSGSQGGANQLLRIDLVDADGREIVDSFITNWIDRQVCIYNGAKHFTVQGDLPFDIKDKGIANIAVSVDTLSGTQTPC